MQSVQTILRVLFAPVGTPAEPVATDGAFDLAFASTPEGEQHQSSLDEAEALQVGPVQAVIGETVRTGVVWELVGRGPVAETPSPVVSDAAEEERSGTGTVVHAGSDAETSHLGEVLSPDPPSGDQVGSNASPLTLPGMPTGPGPRPRGVASSPAPLMMKGEALFVAADAAMPAPVERTDGQPASTVSPAAPVPTPRMDTSVSADARTDGRHLQATGPNAVLGPKREGIDTLAATNSARPTVKVEGTPPNQAEPVDSDVRLSKVGSEPVSPKTPGQSLPLEEPDPALLGAVVREVKGSGSPILPQSGVEGPIAREKLAAAVPGHVALAVGTAVVDERPSGLERPAALSHATADDHAPDAPAPMTADPKAVVPGVWERLFAGILAPLIVRPDGQATLDATPLSAALTGLVATDTPPAIDLPEPEPPDPTPDAPAARRPDLRGALPPGPETAVVLAGQDTAPVPDMPLERGENSLPLPLSPAGPIAAHASGPGAMPAGSTLPVPQIAAQIGAALARTSDGSTELSLSPEELGRVRLKLTPDTTNPDRMVVMITFERPETMDLFRRNGGDLADALRSAGYAGADIGFGQEGGFGSGPDQRDAPSGSRAEGARRPDTAEYAPPPDRLTVGASLDLRL